MILEDKIIDFFGDSITEGTGVVCVENRFDNIIKRECRLKEAYNYGVGGSRFAHQTKASANPRFDLTFCGRAYLLNPDADIILVFGGTNDYGHGDAPFGTFEDKSPDTYCGAVDYIMNFLPQEYPGRKIVFVTPARRTGDLKQSIHPSKGADAKPLKDYVDVLIDKCKRYGFDVINLYENLGINPNNEDHYVRYTKDGLHLNDEGHKILAGYLIKKLQEFAEE